MPNPLSPFRNQLWYGGPAGGARARGLVRLIQRWTGSRWTDWGWYVFDLGVCRSTLEGTAYHDMLWLYLAIYEGHLEVQEGLALQWS